MKSIKEIILTHEDTIKRMASVKEIILLEGEFPPTTIASSFNSKDHRNISVGLDLTGIICPIKEIDRLSRQEIKINKDLTLQKSKLSNPGFLKGASQIKVDG